jgi:hypothetical protein
MAKVVGSLLVSASLLSSGCYHYHVKPDRVAPSTEERAQTQVAYFWGLLQPEDIAPTNCPRGVALAEVTAHTNLGFALIGVLTLGIVLPHTLAWRCAKLPATDEDVVHAPQRLKGALVSRAGAVH